MCSTNYYILLLDSSMWSVADVMPSLSITSFVSDAKDHVSPIWEVFEKKFQGRVHIPQTSARDCNTLYQRWMSAMRGTLGLSYAVMSLVSITMLKLSVWVSGAGSSCLLMLWHSLLMLSRSLLGNVTHWGMSYSLMHAT
jgi:hypothetical protein